MYWLPVLSVLATVPFGLTTSISPCWTDMRSKHSWNSVPEKWEFHEYAPAGTTIDLRIALKPHRENALIDALYEVSDPSGQKYVSIQSFLCVHLLTHVYAHAALQIWSAPVQGASCRARRSASRHTRTCQCLA